MRKLIIALAALAVIIPAIMILFQNQKMATSIASLMDDTIVEEVTKPAVVTSEKVKPVEKTKTIIEDKTQTTTPKEKKERKKIIVIDAGHQRYADYRLERVGPKSDKWLASMPASSYGVVTGQAEYQLTLDVAQGMKNRLQKKGYKVYITREKNVIALTTKERAKIATKHHADLYISLHADGASKPKANGMYLIMPGKTNPYTKSIYKESAVVGQQILAVAKASAIPTYLSGKNYSADLAAINWSTVPTVLVELGYLNNAKDDKRLVTKKYQQKLSTGIVEGIDKYFNKS